MKLWTILSLLMSLSAQTMAFNILMLIPVGSWSEYQLFKALGDTLAGVGHQVTLVSGYRPSKESLLTEIFVGPPSNYDVGNIFELDMVKLISHLNENQKIICNIMYTNQDVLDIWKHRNGFDAIIAASIINDIIAPFLWDFNGTYIGLSPVGIESNTIYNQGNRLPKSVTPFIATNFDENMNFLERVLNLLLDLILVQMYEYDIETQIPALLENYFP
ncbi:unnamed protein product, partial [Meganyctiphanes norvegica]